jgi:Protein of unknown function (DUF2637)
VKRIHLPRFRLPRLPRRPVREPRARRPKPVARPAVGVLGVARGVALGLVAVLVAAASLVSFAESYRALYEWAHEHGLSAHWSAVWPLQIDVFIAVGELALFVALIDAWRGRSRVLPWAVTLLGLAVSVAGNVGHVGWAAPVADKATAAVPPLAAAAALAVGLGVLKRVVEHRPQITRQPGDSAGVPSDVVEAATASMRATVAARNPLTINQLQERFSLSRGTATKLHHAVLAESNGHHPE